MDVLVPLVLQVDTLMDQAGEVRGERAMDWDALEQERGITILSKATALEVQGKDGEVRQGGGGGASSTFW